MNCNGNICRSYTFDTSAGHFDVALPDAHYFDRAFDPILVTGDDGNEYNVIPSDQFK